MTEMALFHPTLMLQERRQSCRHTGYVGDKGMGLVGGMKLWDFIIWWCQLLLCMYVLGNLLNTTVLLI